MVYLKLLSLSLLHVAVNVFLFYLQVTRLECLKPIILLSIHYHTLLTFPL